MKRYAIADEVPEDCDYLTAGKEYEILRLYRDNEEGDMFRFIDDNNASRVGAVNESFHLNGKSWRIVERE